MNNIHVDTFEERTTELNKRRSRKKDEMIVVKDVIVRYDVLCIGVVVVAVASSVVGESLRKLKQRIVSSCELETI